jgi:hypothetical protein
MRHACCRGERLLIASGDGQRVVAAGNCNDQSRCYSQISCRALRPNNEPASAATAYTNELYSSAAALFQPGTHTVLMRVEAQPESEDDWAKFKADMVAPGNPWGASNVFAAFKVDLGGWLSVDPV